MRKAVSKTADVLPYGSQMIVMRAFMVNPFQFPYGFPTGPRGPVS